MSTITAAQVRRDAIQRLIDLAGDEPYDVDMMLGRSDSRAVLRRRVLGRHRADLAVLAELDRIWPLCQGDTVALIDAVASGGLTPGGPPVPTVADLEEALSSWT